MAQTQENTRSTRWDEVEKLGLLWSQGDDVSLARAAREWGLPESTLRYWVERARATEAPPQVVAFFESPQGLWLLHQVVTAAMFVLTQVAGGGTRTVCQFLMLSGLWRFVASGYGPVYEQSCLMEEAIVGFGAVERRRLGANMRPREITIAEDETFHRGEPCLVAQEVVSNFVMVEEYAEDRSAERWGEALTRGMEGLPVRIIQVASDQGSSLLRHCRELGAHHSPDLFHPQQDISRATSLPLEARLKSAAVAVADAEERLHALMEEAESYAGTRRGPGRRRDEASRIDTAEDAVLAAIEAQEQAQAHREQVREAARGISSAYHPYDLSTGQAREADAVAEELGACFDAIEEIAAEAGLAERSMKLLRKARSLLPQMVATIAFVHALIRSRLAALELPAPLLDEVRDALVPALYLDEAARKASTAETRHDIARSAAGLRQRLEAPASAFSALAPCSQAEVRRVARECAQLFQRSSSCVEGRNGTLSLRHHSHHRLNPRKLAALTTIHNFATTRADGTTAAQRFFEQPHRDLFAYLLEHLPPPRRPAAKRTTLH